MNGSVLRRSQLVRRLMAALLGLAVLSWPAAPATADTTVPAARYSELKYLDGTHALLLTLNTDNPVSGLELEHNMRLLDNSGEQLTYDEVVFEVHTKGKGSDITLRGDSLVHEETLPMLPTRDSKGTFTYPLSGPYNILITFRADGEDIATGRFAMLVRKGTDTASLGGFPWIRFGLTLLVGVLIGTLLPRGTRREDQAEAGAEVPASESESESARA